MKKRKVLIGLLAASAMLSIASCKTKDKPTDDPNQNQNENEKQTYTVTFNTNGGSAVSEQKIETGNKATKPSDPSKTDYKFIGWYTDEALTKEFSFDTAITSNITLYAKWEANVIAEDNSYKVSVVDDNNAPVKDVSVQWCNSTNCFAPVKTNAEGVAINSKLKTGDTYYVHLVESTIPQGYTYDPNLYTQTDDSKEITVKLIKLATVTGEGSKESPYNIGVGAYHLEINVDFYPKILQFSF